MAGRRPRTSELSPESPRPFHGLSQLKTISLSTGSSLEVELMNLGAGIKSVCVPAPKGPVNAVLAYPDPGHYLHDPFYLGVTVGRHANRIADARFDLSGKTHKLTPTPGAGGHSLHGGETGFSHRLWDISQVHGSHSAEFSLVSNDGDQGYPGRLEATVRYTVLEDWKLMIDFQAVADADTVVSLANHAYFNLNGDGTGACNHQLQINADRYTPLLPDGIPTGEIALVADTCLDFRQPVAIADRLPSVENGFDHNYVLEGSTSQPCHAASLRSPLTRLRMNLYTTQPGLQFYSGQQLSGFFDPGAGICLEAQGFPNAPNEPGFPGSVLRAGDVYRQQTIYEFLAD